MRDEHEAKMAADAEATAIGRGGRGRARSPGSNSRGGFDVTVEGVAISGPLETSGEIRVAMEHDWRSADIGGKWDSAFGYNAFVFLLDAKRCVISPRANGDESGMDDVCYWWHPLD